MLQAPLADLAQEHPNSQGDAHLISGSKRKWRREFNDPTLAEWVASSGPGMGQWTAANGTVTITMGTTINSESTLTSKQSFTAPFTTQFGLKLSSKIINSEVYVEIVATNPDGSLDETVVAAWRIAGTDSATTTNARLEVRNGGTARTQSAVLTGQAAQTVDAIYEIRLESDEIWFSSRTPNSTAAKNVPQVWNLVSPDPEREYKVRLRVRNGATAPASSVTFTGSFVTVVDYTEQQVNIVGGDASSVPANSVPVYVSGSGTLPIGGTVTPVALATGTGTLLAKVLSAASVNNTLVKATAARLYGYNLANMTASWRFVKFYNKATAPVAGTDVPVMTIAIPPNSVVDGEYSIPITFATGLGYAITGAVADLDTTVVAANDVVGFLAYI